MMKNQLNYMYIFNLLQSENVLQNTGLMLPLLEICLSNNIPYILFVF